MQRTPLPGGPVRVRNGKRTRKRTGKVQKIRRESAKCKKKKAEQIRKYVKKSGKEKDEKEQERIPKRCSAVQSSRRNNGTMETQDLARLGELPMALASLRNFCPSMNLGHLSALPGQT
jgi:hypothetical protein